MLKSNRRQRPRPRRVSPRVPVDQQRKELIDDDVVRGVWYLRDHTWGDDPPDLAGFGIGVGMEATSRSYVAGVWRVPASDPVVQKAAALSALPRARQAVTRAATLIRWPSASCSWTASATHDDVELTQFLALRLRSPIQRPADGGLGLYLPAINSISVRNKNPLNNLKDGKQTLDQWRQTGFARVNLFDSLAGRTYPNTQFAAIPRCGSLRGTALPSPNPSIWWKAASATPRRWTGT